MTSTPPPAHVAEMHESELANARIVCLAKLHAGELPLVVNSVERDDAGNMIDRGYRLTPRAGRATLRSGAARRQRG